jgi:hypothetical protein
MSSRASNKGFKYGSIFSDKSPGKKPRLSPASTAGRASTTFVTCLLFNAEIANATARYVFPVPAGPIAKTISLFIIALK